jgi:hypothetical protein
MRAFLLVLGCAAALAGGVAIAEGDGLGQPVELVTNFENGELIDADGLVIGGGPTTAILTGGQVEIRAVRPAYQSPPHAWVFDQGEVGMIEFLVPVREMHFFAAVNVNRGSAQQPRGDGFFSLLDEDGEVIKHPVLLLSDEEGARLQVFEDGLFVPLINGHPQTLFSVKPIAAIVITNTVQGDSFLSVDDLAYRAVAR